MAETPSNTVTSHIHGGRVVSGQVNGENVTIVQGNYYAASQPLSSSSSSSSQPNIENWQKKLETVQTSLKEMYLESFKKTNPFSLPFTFDIENTWVSLALREDPTHSQATENHAELLKNAFAKAKMLIIEGKPATGKTSLMRRLAYEWAKGNNELSHYNLIACAEFREVRKQTLESIADLVLEYTKSYIEDEELIALKTVLSNRSYCKQLNILLLLDGFDESSLDKHCKEMTTYLTSSNVKKPLVFNIVLTTRPGYLSNLQGQQGRFVFAEVLGFRTKQQKEKYIYNHFLSSKIDKKQNIAAVRRLLDNNENLNKLAETPLFLTFICLVHERIVDGTLVELYCNIIWWLIDRHQKNNPDYDIAALFGFQNGSNDKFETIQEHFLHFPQLHCLGNMALHKLQDNVFMSSDLERSQILSIVERVGLLRKEKKHDNSFKLITSFFFSHRTIQEFLAAFYCFCSSDSSKEWLLPDSKLDTSEKGMNEFSRFLFRIALSDNMPIHAEKRKYYFERIAVINLDMRFDAFNTTAGFNDKLLNWFFSQCTNVQNIKLRDELINARHARNMSNYTSIFNGSNIISKMSSSTRFSFSDLIKLHSLTFDECTFSANSQLSFTNCPSLKNLILSRCKMKSCTNLNIPALPAIDTVIFDECKINLATWKSVINQISNSSVKFLQLWFGEDFDKEVLTHLQNCNNIEKMEIIIRDYYIRPNDQFSFSDLIKLHSLRFSQCTFSANSQLSFTNCPTIKNLKFNQCAMKSSTIVDITPLPAIDTMEFDECNINLTIWKSITEAIRNSFVKCFKLTFGRDFKTEFLIHLQKCNNVEKMEIKIENYTIRQNDLLSFTDLNRLLSLTFGDVDAGCTFSANSQLSFTNCPSLKKLKFKECEMESSTIAGIETLPAIDTVQFYRCNIDLATWQSISDQISKSSIKSLKVEFGDHFNKEFLTHLQKCNNVEKMDIKIEDYTIRQNDLLSFSYLIKLHSLTFFKCGFSANSLLSFTNCPSLKKLKFDKCVMESSTNLGIAILSAIDTVEFKECANAMATWQSILEQIRNSSLTCLQLSAGYFVKETYLDFLHHLQKCERIQQIHVKDDYKYVLNRYEKEVTANLAQTAQKLSLITNITIFNDDVGRLNKFRLKTENKEKIEKAGQERNPDFLIKYAE